MVPILGIPRSHSAFNIMPKLLDYILKSEVMNYFPLAAQISICSVTSSCFNYHQFSCQSYKNNYVHVLYIAQKIFMAHRAEPTLYMYTSGTHAHVHVHMYIPFQGAVCPFASQDVDKEVHSTAEGGRVMLARGENAEGQLE